MLLSSKATHALVWLCMTIVQQFTTARAQQPLLL
jgi:hypothetical protein